MSGKLATGRKDVEARLGFGWKNLNCACARHLANCGPVKIRFDARAVGSFAGLLNSLGLTVPCYANPDG